MVFAAVAAMTIVAGVSGAVAQDNATVIHRNDNGDRSKIVVRDDDGARTVIKRHGNHVKKAHASPNGDKKVVK